LPCLALAESRRASWSGPGSIHESMLKRKEKKKKEKDIKE